VGGNNIFSLEGIQSFINLEELYCSYNQLSVLDLSNNVHLRKLDCKYNQLTSLNVTQSPNLYYLWLYRNFLTTLDISQNVNLETLWAGNNQFTDLDVTNNPNLIELHCDDSQLTELDVSQNLNLELLICSNNPLETLDVSANLQLWNLDIGSTAITTLDLSSNINLKEFYGGNNELEVLKINNGYNHKITLMFTEGNSPLMCIQVDDENATYPECGEWLPIEGWCIDPWTSYSENCKLGIDDSKQNGFTLYPNPVSSALIVSSAKNGSANLVAEIFTMEGKAILSKILEFKKQASIDVSNFPQGMYLLKLEDDNGNVEVRKFIKQ